MPEIESKQNNLRNFILLVVCSLNQNLYYSVRILMVFFKIIMYNKI